MSIILKSFTEPTNLVISGRYYENISETFSITDDYHSFLLIQDDMKQYMESTGFVYIFTEYEYEQVKDLESDDAQDLVHISGFKGDVILKLLDDGTKEEIDISKFDLKDYLMYQTPDHFEWGDVILVLQSK